MTGITLSSSFLASIVKCFYCPFLLARVMCSRQEDEDRYREIIQEMIESKVGHI